MTSHTAQVNTWCSTPALEWTSQQHPFICLRGGSFNLELQMHWSLDSKMKTALCTLSLSQLGQAKLIFTLFILSHTQHTHNHFLSFPSWEHWQFQIYALSLQSNSSFFIFLMRSEIEILGNYNTGISSFRQYCINGISFEVRENHVHTLVSTFPGWANSHHWSSHP